MTSREGKMLSDSLFMAKCQDQFLKTCAVHKLLKVPFSAISLKTSLGNVIIRWPLLRCQHYDVVEVIFDES